MEGKGSRPVKRKRHTEEGAKPRRRNLQEKGLFSWIPLLWPEQKPFIQTRPLEHKEGLLGRKADETYQKRQQPESKDLQSDVATRFRHRQLFLFGVKLKEQGFLASRSGTPRKRLRSLQDETQLEELQERTRQFASCES